MDEHIFDKVNEVDLKQTMETSYIDYAMSVIASRALPDVRDGLKPVQRRILYAMIELNNGPDKPHRKCARIVGDTMGKYHPHGDSSIYGALVNLAQDWSTHYPLVDGHGNFGSVDGDGAAAMRYTEARLSKISMEMLADINKDTVDFIPNFDETEKEPTVLPSRFPNLLVNGTSGIAVGMATNIPPHNLRETIDAVVKIIDNKVEEDRDTTIEELMEIVKGPDFPTGATILGHAGIESAYRTGRGKIYVRATTTIEPMANGKNRIVVTELPYLVNKAKLIEKIAELVREKRLDGITELRDESSRAGMRVCIELRKDVNPNIMLNQLFKHTQMQDTFGIINLALVNNEPVVMNLHQMLGFYLEHQESVVRRRTQYDLNKAEERAHILEGLLKALDFIDEVISIIRAAANTPEAKTKLMERFELDDAQAQAIVDMRLRALTGLERERLQNEYDELEAKIAEYKEILGNEKKLLGVIRTEILEIREKYGDDRKTVIGFDDSDISNEDLIPDEPTVLAMTHMGYIKRMTVDYFKSQNRGGKGIKGIQTIEDDFIEDMVMTTTHHTILFFTNQGRVYRLKVYKIPEASRTARGTAMVNLLQMQPGEHPTAVITLKKGVTEGYLFMATKNGTVKKTSLSDFMNIRKSGMVAISLREGDELIEVKRTSGNDHILLVTKKGMSIRFEETDARPLGRASMGVRGIRLSEGDEVVAMQLPSEGEYLLTVCENGFGKRTSIDAFRLQSRGGKGISCHKLVEKTGDLVGAKMVGEDTEILMISDTGIIIRTSVEDVRIVGRSSSGVKMMNLGEDAKVASLTKVKKYDNDDASHDEEVLEGELEDALSEDELEEEGILEEDFEEDTEDEILGEDLEDEDLIEDEDPEEDDAEDDDPDEDADAEKELEKSQISELLRRAEEDAEDEDR